LSGPRVSGTGSLGPDNADQLSVDLRVGTTSRHS
jgi:hypothetical protein